MINQLLTVDEVSNIFKISPKTIYEWVKLEKLPSVKLFSEVRFRRIDIDNICKNGLQKPERENNFPRPKPKIKAKSDQKRVGLWEKSRENLLD